jgi:hypothetical protein
MNCEASNETQSIFVTVQYLIKMHHFVLRRSWNGLGGCVNILLALAKWFFNSGSQNLTLMATQRFPS